MTNKKFILNADDFGMSQDYNRAVLVGYEDGFLRSASICANGPSFESAINEILPECQELSLGVHLNIIEGKSLTHCPLLTDEKGNFNNGYLAMILKSNNREFLSQTEKEFRAQIERVQAVAKPDHIDSHVHVHAIPPIFKLVCRLAKAYKIPYVRTQNEILYAVDNKKKTCTVAYGVNIIKNLLLKFFTMQNKKLLPQYGLKTNDYLIGVCYTAMMNSQTLEDGLKAIEGDNIIAECLIHPKNYAIKKDDHHAEEFKLSRDKLLQDTIYRLGFEISNHKNL